VKTGRLVKLLRGTTEIQLYLFREGPKFQAAIYVGDGATPLHTVVGAEENAVELEARAWVSGRFTSG
jgi:hypothetical protein